MKTRNRFLIYLALFATPLAVIGCNEAVNPGDNDNSVAIQNMPEPVQEEVVPEPEPEPAPRQAVNAFAQRVAEGQQGLLAFDACPFDDEGYDDPATDPLGLIKCGEVYRIRYIPETSQWNAYGLDEGGTALNGENYYKDYTGPGSDPYLGRLTLWGINFGVNAQGEVIQGSDVIVGHLTFE